MGDNAGKVAVQFSAVHRHFGEVRAVDGVDMEIYNGEFFSMLGPSGSGKTTCLRLMAGFEKPSSGKIELDGQDCTTLPPFLRDLHPCFPDDPFLLELTH